VNDIAITAFIPSPALINSTPNHSFEFELAPPPACTLVLLGGNGTGGVHFPCPPAINDESLLCATGGGGGGRVIGMGESDFTLASLALSGVGVGDLAVGLLTGKGGGVRFIESCSTRPDLMS